MFTGDGFSLISGFMNIVCIPENPLLYYNKILYIVQQRTVPALREVGQLVLEAVLEELEHDGDDGAQPPVTEDQGLEGACWSTALHSTNKMM